MLNLQNPNLKIQLTNTNSLISPGYTLWVRNSNTVTSNRSLALPSCLYTGTSVGRGTQVHVSLSTCSGEVEGSVDLDGVQFHLVSQEQYLCLSLTV